MVNVRNSAGMLAVSHHFTRCKQSFAVSPKFHSNSTVRSEHTMCQPFEGAAY